MSNIIQAFLTRFASSIGPNPASQVDRVLFQIYSAFLVLGIPTMLGFALYNYLQFEYLIFSMIILSLAGLIIGWFILRRYGNSKLVIRINGVLFGALILYSFFIGGDSGSKILWMYTLPLIAFFLLGKKEGAVWCVLIFILSILLFWNPLGWTIAYEYSQQFKQRFLLTFLIVSSITYWFEYFRYHYRIDIELKNKKLRQEIKERKDAENDRERLIEELRLMLDKVKTLSGLLPICASCKKIRDDNGYWNQIECYIRAHSSVEFTHGICPDCTEKLYPEYCKHLENKASADTDIQKQDE